MNHALKLADIPGLVITHKCSFGFRRGAQDFACGPILNCPKRCYTLGLCELERVVSSKSPKNNRRFALLLRFVKPLLLVCVGIAFPVQSFAQTLNMSHDLVTLGIAAQNLTPNNPSLDSGPLIQAAFNYVQNHSVDILTLNKGDY